MVTVVAIMAAMLGLSAPQAFAEGNADPRACERLISVGPPNDFFLYSPGYDNAGCTEVGEPF
jgi:hypothetical protein